MACQKPKPNKIKTKGSWTKLWMYSLDQLSKLFLEPRSSSKTNTHTHLHMCNFFMYLSHLRYLNGLLTEAPEKIVNWSKAKTTHKLLRKYTELFMERRTKLKRNKKRNMVVRMWRNHCKSNNIHKHRKYSEKNTHTKHNEHTHTHKADEKPTKTEKKRQK